MGWIVLLLLLGAAFGAYKLLSKSFLGTRVEVDWSSEKIYGWYYGHVMTSARFSPSDTPEEIQAAKDSVTKELKELIEKRNKIK